MTALREKKGARKNHNNSSNEQHQQQHDNNNDDHRRSCIIPLDIPQVDDNVYGQIHPVETPTLIAEKVDEFDQALERLLSQQKSSKSSPTAIQLAQEKCPDLLTCDFKLVFLRCEVFNVDRAVKRYAKYWKKRVDTFGPVKAFLPLTTDGALKDDEDALRIYKVAMADITETKDYLGRRVIFLNYSKFDSADDAKSRLRTFWYVMHQALFLDQQQQQQKHGGYEETQKYGVVFMVYTGKKMKFWDFDMKSTMQTLETLQGCIPVRVAAFHICFPPRFATAVVGVLKLFMSSRLRKRILLHNGSFEEVKQRLSSPYGIEKELHRCDDHLVE